MSIINEFWQRRSQRDDPQETAKVKPLPPTEPIKEPEELPPTETLHEFPKYDPSTEAECPKQLPGGVVQPHPDVFFVPKKPNVT